MWKYWNDISSIQRYKDRVCHIIRELHNVSQMLETVAYDDDAPNASDKRNARYIYFVFSCIDSISDVSSSIPRVTIVTMKTGGTFVTYMERNTIPIEIRYNRQIYRRQFRLFYN